MKTSGAAPSKTASPPDQDQISRFVTAVFQAWQEAAIEFLILRNYERLPQFTSNDVDVLVSRPKRDQAERIMVETALALGLRRHNRAEFATLANFFHSPASGEQVHVDLFVDLKWRSFDFIRCQEFLAQRVPSGSFAIPHPTHEAATNLLATLIYNGTIKDKYKASIITGFRQHPQLAKDLLARSYGPKLAKFIVEAGSQGKWNELQDSSRALRRRLVLGQFLTSPLSLLRSFALDARRLIKRWLQPPGLTVVLCGTDGSGKSTAAQLLIDELAVTFPREKVRQFHWKPPIFSARRMAQRSPTTDPHALQPRSTALSIVYFAFHWFEFFLGSFLRIKPVTFKNGLVLIDRWYYDFYVDQRRYRLKTPMGLVRGGYSLLRKPDLVLLLDAPAEILQGRKQEVAITETKRQREAYLELVRRLPQGHIIDAAQPPDAVARDLKTVILEFMAARIERRAHRVSPGLTSRQQTMTEPKEGRS